jgi:hypothetical protein
MAIENTARPSTPKRGKLASVEGVPTSERSEVVMGLPLDSTRSRR